MHNEGMITYDQTSAYESGRSVRERLLQLLWNYMWIWFCSWTPKPMNGWRLMWLRLFGCKLYGKPFVHPLARITVPWNLTMHDRSALGERTTAYTLGAIVIEERATVAQEAYLCSATHKFDDPNIPLVTAPITIKADSFIGARAFVMPGITIGEGTVIGACSVVTKDVPDWVFAVGNPCRVTRPRQINKAG